MAGDRKRGPFVVFEGIDGSGKSSQISRISLKLKAMGVQVCDTCEPTDGPIGSLIKQMMVGRIQGAHETIAALFVADRVDHLLNTTNGILFKINNGVCVISDRYYFSSYAYHSSYVDMDWVIAANSISANILRPDINIFIDTSPEICFERLSLNRFHLDIYENLEVLRAARKNYLIAIERLSDVENVAVVDGDGDAEEVEKKIWHIMERYYG